MSRSLTAAERETVILMSDADDRVEICTHQRPVYTKLKNNPAFELVEDLSWGKSIGGRFVGPAEMISFRAKSRRGAALTPEQKRERAERLRRASGARHARPTS